MHRSLPLGWALALLVLFTGAGSTEGSTTTPGVVPRPPIPRNPSAFGDEGELLHGIVTPRDQVVLTFPIEGVLNELPIREGSRVVEGQILARLDDRVARASLALAEAKAAAKGEIQVAHQELAHAERSLERLLAAHERGVGTPSDLDAALARRNQARATLESRKEARALAKTALELERARLDQHILRAPFAGRIVRLGAERGATVGPNHELLMLVSLDVLEAEIHLPASMMARLHQGKPYLLRASEPVNQTLECTLRRIDPMIDPATLLVRCVFEIQNESGELPAGFTVELAGRP